jgi:uncharacterized protein YacL
MKDMKMNLEKRPHTVAGIFESEDQAKHAEESLIDQGPFHSEEVQLLKPGDTHLQDRLEPETKAIGKELILWHYILGAAGLVAGLIIAAIVTTIGPTFTQSSPMLTYLVLGMFGVFFGMIAAGAFTVRPDHDPLINETMEATKDNKWAVIVQARDRDAQQRARQLLSPSAISVIDTL